MDDPLPDWMRPDADREKQQGLPEPNLGPNTEVSVASSTQGLPDSFLQVSDQERLRASIFSRLIESEGIRVLAQLPNRKAASPVLRFLTIIMILSAVLLPQLLSIRRMVFAPPDVTPRVLQVFQLLRNLSPGEPVLLAVDYEPGLSGELNAATIPILNQLFDQQAFVAAVSTVITGPVQAESLRMLSKYNPADSRSVDRDYVNFGYVPGGQTGLQNFLQSPQSIFLPGSATLDAAGQQKIDQIDSLSDFVLIIIATDRQEVARDWIEQIQPSLQTTPVLMILSAQAGPVINPYIEENPGQIQGIIVGMADSLSIGALVNQPSVPMVNWVSYNFGLVAAIILIGSAGAWYLVLANTKNHSHPG